MWLTFINFFIHQELNDTISHILEDNIFFIIINHFHVFIHNNKFDYYCKKNYENFRKYFFINSIDKINLKMEIREKQMIDDIIKKL